MASLLRLPAELHYLIGTYLAPLDLANYLSVLQLARVVPPGRTSFCKVITQLYRQPSPFKISNHDLDNGFGLTWQALESDCQVNLIAGITSNADMATVIPNFYKLTTELAQVGARFEATTVVSQIVNKVHRVAKFYHDSTLVAQGYYYNNVKVGQWFLTKQLVMRARREDITYQVSHRESGGYQDNLRQGPWLLEQLVVELSGSVVVTRTYRSAQLNYQAGAKHGPVVITSYQLSQSPNLTDYCTTTGNFNHNRTSGHWIVQTRTVNSQGSRAEFQQVYDLDQPTRETLIALYGLPPNRVKCQLESYRADIRQSLQVALI